ncbi:hypothetical protein GJU39_12905 [Pedobacter petrophilus]|uniref:Glycoside hydrolase n=2 Tax=Pedobacter TaxID=84567 RepID=A0A7K0G1Y4_9SPHI|nr:hypothetical protein [Pedobacter petrophilus]MRX76986.1 hypothetical protein [Pedobacter petrophilus]
MFTFNNSYGQGAKGSSKGKPAKPELIFQSGFEGTSKVIPFKGSDNDIIGKDTKLNGKNDWVADLEKIGGGQFNLQYTGGDSTKRIAQIIPEPGNIKNKVLMFSINDSWLASEGQQKARVQANIYGIKKGYKEFYQSVRMFIPADFNVLRSFPEPIKWLTISEFWNNEWWVSTEKYGFRVTLGIGKPKAEESDFNFILNGENAGQKEVWKADNTAIKVPVGKWFTMEYYFKDGDAQNGRFYMAITPQNGKKQVVFDVHNFTHNTTDMNSDGLTGYNPMKLYTSKELVAFGKAHNTPLRIYWDDFKLWKNKTPESQMANGKD